MTERKKRGRPIKDPAGDRRGANITFRTPGGLRERLEEAAGISGRSISEEVVYRLERSFERQGLLQEAFALTWGEDMARLMLSMHKSGVLRMKPSVRAVALKKIEDHLLKEIPEAAAERNRTEKTPDQQWEIMKAWADQSQKDEQ